MQPAEAGYYTVVVSNPYGSATSGVAVLTVTVPPRLGIHWSSGLPRLDLFEAEKGVSSAGGDRPSCLRIHPGFQRHGLSFR